MMKMKASRSDPINLNLRFKSRREAVKKKKNISHFYLSFLHVCSEVQQEKNISQISTNFACILTFTATVGPADVAVDDRQVSLGPGTEGSLLPAATRGRRCTRKSAVSFSSENKKMKVYLVWRRSRDRSQEQILDSRATLTFDLPALVAVSLIRANLQGFFWTDTRDSD